MSGLALAIGIHPIVDRHKGPVPDLCQNWKVLKVETANYGEPPGFPSCNQRMREPIGGCQPTLQKPSVRTEMSKKASYPPPPTG